MPFVGWNRIPIAVCRKDTVYSLLFRTLANYQPYLAADPPCNSANIKIGIRIYVKVCFVINEYNRMNKCIRFRDTVALIFRKIPHGTCAIFLQSDFRVMDLDGNVISWVDKSYLCSSAAEAEQCDLLWHKMVSNI